MRTHPRIWNAVLSAIWLMDEPQVRRLMDVIEQAETREDAANAIEAVEAQLGRRMDNARSTTMRGGVAILPVTGPIFRYANLFTSLSGATSTEDLSLDFNAAMQDPSVDAILLNIDSPGGEATGINEFADMIHASSKPVWAYIEGYGASAAYWIASATQHIVMDATAAAGSIGVVMAVPAPGGAPAKSIEFVSSQSPNKRPDPTTERGKAQLQTMVDDMAGVFVSKVAQYRGVSEEDVLSRFGAGGMTVGKGAVASGMADALGSFESTLTALQQHARDTRMQGHTRAQFSAHEHFTRSFKTGVTA